MAIELCIWLLVGFRGISYWVLSALQHPGELLSVQALYRAGDMEYFPLIQALAKGNFGELALLDTRTSYLASFPFASIALHSLLYKFFGIWGLAVADGIATLAYFWVLTQVFLIFQFPKRAAQAIALLVVSGALNQLLAMGSDPIFSLLILPNQGWLGWSLTGILGIIVTLMAVGKRAEFNGAKIGAVMLTIVLPIIFSTLPLQLWGLRLPRPFVSEFFFLLCISLAGRLFLNPERHSKPLIWGALGLSLSALLQGDFHSTVVAAIALAGLLGLRVFQDRSIEWRGLGCFVLSFGVGIVPFLLQRLQENPQAPIRLGVFNIDRIAPLFLPGWMPLVMLLGLLVLGGFCWRLGVPKKTVIFWGIWSIAACFALPISTLLLGKTVQPYQFLDRYERVILLSLILLIGSGFQTFKFKKLQSERLILPIVLAIALAFNLKEMNGLVQVKSHMRSDFSEWGKLENYRLEFDALTQELKKPEYQQLKVMGSFDIQPYVWWVGFNQGNSFLPPAPLTIVNDDEIETRLAQFCQLIGMSPQQYLNMINRRLTQIFWLGHNKYQASGAYTFAPLSDYTPQAQAMIAQTGTLNSQNVILPISEQRLIQQYLKPIPTLLPKLDLIILTKDEMINGLTVQDNRFIKSYENAVFEVWIRRDK
jgi:hypothetical protein